jgi:hypothetical protein
VAQYSGAKLGLVSATKKEKNRCSETILQCSHVYFLCRKITKVETLAWATPWTTITLYLARVKFYNFNIMISLAGK